MFIKHLLCLYHTFLSLEILGARRTQYCSAALYDVCHGAAVEFFNIIHHQTVVAVPYSDHLESVVECCPYYSADRGIHSWCITTTRENADFRSH